MNPDNNTKQTNKKLILGVLIGVGVLVLVLIGLVVALLVGQNNDNSETANQNSSSQSSENADSDNNADTDSKQIVKRFATKNDKIEVVFYKPVQKGSNTTFEFGLRNKCDGCEDRVYAGANDLLGLVSSQAYLLDESEGKKYSVITDADGDALATQSCSGYVEPGETKDCFISFTKVPAGSTVSFVTNREKIDGFKID